MVRVRGVGALQDTRARRLASSRAQLAQTVPCRALKIVFIIAMPADVIHGMNEGRVAESGTHAELVALGGRYAASWRAQMREAEGGAGVV